jgi:Phage integrase SAM-like domain
MFHIVSRDDAGRLKRDPVGHNRKAAERALRKVEVQIDEGIYTPQENILFSTWADRWLAALQRKATTVESYRSTVDYAKRAFGTVTVRKVRPEHVAKMDELMRERRDRKGKPKPLTASTRAKHLRVLHACLESAIAHSYATSNPVKLLPKAERPRPTKKEAIRYTGTGRVRRGRLRWSGSRAPSPSEQSAGYAWVGRRGLPRRGTLGGPAAP